MVSRVFGCGQRVVSGVLGARDGVETDGVRAPFVRGPDSVLNTGPGGGIGQTLWT